MGQHRSTRRDQYVAAVLRDHGALAGRACALHPHHGQPDADDIGMRWAIAWYRNIQSRTSRLGDGHVAA